MSKLNIYRCSAGSGKTFKITEEYLKLLFTDPENYKHILSVTFTNKAMEEMKSRILHEIYKLANSENSPYFKIISENFNLTGTEVLSAAKIILRNILHDYSRFSVETIESFFQKIIRCFVKEIGINSGYNLEFNIAGVLEDVIEELFIDIDENISLRQWLVQFAANKISEGKSWDLKRDIFKLSYEVLKEEFLFLKEDQIEKFSDKDFLSGYLNELKQIMSVFENYFRNIGKSALELIKNHSLEITDFSFAKTGVAGYFEKLTKSRDFDPKIRVRSCYNSLDKWYVKTSKYKDEIIACYNNGLNELLGNAINHFDKHKISYYSANLILKRIYALGILLDISKKIKDHSSENNIMLISNSAKILSEVIGDTDAPFIYEKTGSYYRHFMMDEFQDTSGLQWNNFKPLIDNSLSEGNNCMLVGDVKQSIYRWRNGNWNLLAEDVEKQYKQFGVNNLTLNFNWRSKKNIVDFNNALFSLGSRRLQEIFNNSILPDYRLDNEIIDLMSLILRAYKDIHQELPGSNNSGEGYVKLSIVGNSDEVDWEETVIRSIPLIIKDLQDRGYSLGDIAIIVRDHNHGKLVADFLLDHKAENKTGKYKYDFISNESLLVGNSLHIKFLIHLIKYFINSEDQINNAFIVHHYYSYIRTGDDIECSNEQYNGSRVHSYFYSVSQNSDCIKNIFIENGSDYEQLKYLSLYELTEELNRTFRLNESVEEIPYLQSFADILLDFTSGKSGDMNEFIEWWEQEGKAKSINISNKQDAITLTTIHKSKGLEFKAVIIPFCNWEIDAHALKSNIIWCKPGVKPFDRIDRVPLDYSSSMAETIFYKDYYYEKVQQYIDNMNLLYVACTRAEEELYIFSPVPGKKENIRNIGDLIYNVVNFENNKPVSPDEEKVLTFFDKFLDHERLIFEIGSTNFADKNDKQVKADKNTGIQLNDYPTYRKIQNLYF